MDGRFGCSDSLPPPPSPIMPPVPHTHGITNSVDKGGTVVTGGGGGRGRACDARGGRW